MHRKTKTKQEKRRTGGWLVDMVVGWSIGRLGGWMERRMVGWLVVACLLRLCPTVHVVDYFQFHIAMEIGTHYQHQVFR